MAPPPRPTVIIVEDEEVVSMFLRESLLDAGFLVRVFSEAKPALHPMMDPAIDAAVIDVGLPDMQGDALARRCHEHRPTLPVILTTGYDQQHYEDLLITDAYVRVLGKPFDVPRLLLRLEELGVVAVPLVSNGDSAPPAPLAGKL